MKDWQGLLDWCRKWTKSEPKNADAWYGLGIAYNKLKRHDDAIEAYRQALHIDPEDADAWNNLGVHLQRPQAATMMPSKPIVRPCASIRSMPKPGTTSGSLTANFKRHNDAIDAYRQALRINPKNANAWYNLGVAYGKLKSHNDAIEAYRQALRINPKHALPGTTSGSLTATSSATMMPSRPSVRPYALIRRMPLPGTTSGSLTTTSSATMTLSKPIVRPCASVRRIPTAGTTSGSLTPFPVTGQPPWKPSGNCDASILNRPISYST